MVISTMIWRFLQLLTKFGYLLRSMKKVYLNIKIFKCFNFSTTLVWWLNTLKLFDLIWVQCVHDTHYMNNVGCYIVECVIIDKCQIIVTYMKELMVQKDKEQRANCLYFSPFLFKGEKPIYYHHLIKKGRKEYRIKNTSPIVL